MAKRKTPAKSKPKSKKPVKPKVYTAEDILADWKKTAKRGLGSGKDFDRAIFQQFDEPLLAKIQEQLDAGRDYNVDGPNTRAVAKDLGKICRLFTPGSSVGLGIFEVVFKLCKLHPKCPGGGPGGGVWCNI